MFKKWWGRLMLASLVGIAGCGGNGQKGGSLPAGVQSLVDQWVRAQQSNQAPDLEAVFAPDYDYNGETYADVTAPDPGLESQTVRFLQATYDPATGRVRGALTGTFRWTEDAFASRLRYDSLRHSSRSFESQLTATISGDVLLEVKPVGNGFRITAYRPLSYTLESTATATSSENNNSRRRAAVPVPHLSSLSVNGYTDPLGPEFTAAPGMDLSVEAMVSGLLEPSEGDSSSQGHKVEATAGAGEAETFTSLSQIGGKFVGTLPSPTVPGRYYIEISAGNYQSEEGPSAVTARGARKGVTIPFNVQSPPD